MFFFNLYTVIGPLVVIGDQYSLLVFKKKSPRVVMLIVSFSRFSEIRNSSKTLKTHLENLNKYQE